MTNTHAEAYSIVKAQILSFVQAVGEAYPPAAEYLRRHLHFDDARGTVHYSGNPNHPKIRPGAAIHIPADWLNRP